jgi:hypothetical protein
MLQSINRSLVRVRPALIGALALPLALLPFSAYAGTSTGSLTFTNTELTNTSGLSEPAISMSSGGTMAITGLQWDLNPSSFGTNFWTGPFGSTPTFQGLLDSQLQQPGKTIFGSGDADVDFGSTGTVHATTLLFFINPKLNKAKLGVVAVSCPNAMAASFSVSSCRRTIFDTAGTDRPWVTSDGPHVYISYHDSGNSALIHVQRSDDDGVTWTRAASPIPGQGSTTADSTFNNIQGRIMADPHTHSVYAVYAAGVTGVLKARSFTPNQIFVSQSTNMGKTWTAHLVYAAAPGTSLAHIFPTLTVDPTNGHLYTAWSDGHTVWFSASSDQAAHWSAPVAVNIAPASSALMPALAAHNGAVDLAYYATTDANTLDTAAVWNTYMAQTTNAGASFTQSIVSNHPNHIGPVCTGGTGCTTGTRNLLDLFEVAIDPLNGRAAIIYTDDNTGATVSAPDFACLPGETTCPLPQLQLAQQQ